MDGFTLITQYTFLITFLGMASASLYFFMERDSLAPEFRSAATISGIYCAIAATLYFKMQGIVGTDGNPATLLAFPTEYRYIDWIVTTPLMLVKFALLLQISQDKRGLVWIMVIADLIMIVCGYFGEHLLNTSGASTEVWMLFALGTLAWLFLLFIIFSSLTEFSRDKVAPVKKAFAGMRLFIAFGWAVYPIGFMVACFTGSTEAKIARELIYNIADLVNKVGLGLVVVMAAQQITRDAQIRDALRQI